MTDDVPRVGEPVRVVWTGQRVRTRQVLELLDQSVHAHRTGNAAAVTVLLDAAMEIDAAVVQAVRGGILLGEIPNPDTDPQAWADYLDAWGAAPGKRVIRVSAS